MKRVHFPKRRAVLFAAGAVASLIATRCAMLTAQFGMGAAKSAAQATLIGLASTCVYAILYALGFVLMALWLRRQVPLPRHGLLVGAIIACLGSILVLALGLVLSAFFMNQPVLLLTIKPIMFIGLGLVFNLCWWWAVNFSAFFKTSESQS